MVDEAETENESASSTGAPKVDAAPLHDAGFDKMMRIGTPWLQFLSDVSAEMAGFLAERIKEDVKTQHKLLHCKTAAELHYIQSQFIQKATDQYRAKFGKLVEMTSKDIGPKER